MASATSGRRVSDITAVTGSRTGGCRLKYRRRGSSNAGDMVGAPFCNGSGAALGGGQGNRRRSRDARISDAVWAILVDGFIGGDRSQRVDPDQLGPHGRTPLSKASVCLDSVKVILVCAATGWERFGYAVYPLTSPFTRGSLSLRAASCGKWLLSRQWPLSSQLRRLLSASRSRVWVDSCAGNRNKAQLSATCRFREA